MQILIIGSGFMANEYLKVLSNSSHNIIVVSRSPNKVKELSKNYIDNQNIIFISGGIENYFKNGGTIPDACINCVSIENLFETTCTLLRNNVKKILVEKPGSLSIDEIESLEQISIEKEALIRIGYNRNFYSSVSRLVELCETDGGITSLNFEFTEWIHTIKQSEYSEPALNKWMLSNSSHVIELAFKLIGFPKKITSIQKGIDNISWHKSGSIFIGCGISTTNIPFSYHSNWESAGRWGVEIFTKEGKYSLRPLEKLSFQKKGTLNIVDIEIENEIEKLYKHGIYKQLNSFLENDYKLLVSLSEQKELIKIINEIAGYE